MKINHNTNKLIRNVRNIARYAPHRVYALILIGLAVLIPSLAIWAYGPERQTYTINSPADKITFNSITDNPNWGDERNSVLVRDGASTSNNDWRDELQVQDGKEYTIKMIVHNNAADNLNLVATNVRVNADIPTTTGTEASIQSAIMSDNASPQKIWDNVVLKSDKRFNVAFVPGSARYYNNINNTTGFQLPDSLISAAGTPVGYEQMDGNLKGCFQYSGFLYYKVKVYGELTANYEMSKQVRKHVEGQKGNWQKSVAVNPGEKVDYLVSYKNTGTANQQNVVVKDSLPAKVTYNPGSTRLFNESNPAPLGMVASDNITTANGINVGDYAPQTNALVTFTATTPQAQDLACGNNTLRNTAFVETDNGNKQDTADVTITKECKDQPVYSCDMIEATKVSALEYSFNVKVTAKNATAKDVVIDFGDGQNAIRDLSSLPVKHTYTKAGQYTIVAKASFQVDGKTVKDITSETCKTVINTDSPTVVTTGTTSTPNAPAPQSLPSTGPAEVIIGLAGASALGLGIQQWIASRRAVEAALHHK